ncbi:MAG: VanZ family protein [Firmicutes bacterium]|nr:VanZ family protein [Bacillota bacterium]
MKFKLKKQLVHYLIALICLTGIAYFSSQPFSEQDLRPALEQHQKVMRGVRELPEIKFHYGSQRVNSREDPADFIQFWIRKGAHVLSYGILGLSLAAILSVKGLTGAKKILSASVLIVLVALADEWHQTFVPGRTGRAIDVALDLAGFLILAFIAWLGKQITKFVQHKAYRNSTIS